MQFIDRVEINVVAGKGGDGIVAFRREKFVPAGGPAGGNGGDGGSVILEATDDLQTLLDLKFEHVFKADNGKRGGRKNMTGARGSDRLIKVPCGTIVINTETEAIVGDLVEPRQQLVVAKGGKGGLGNRFFLSNRNRAPEHSLPGLEGEEFSLRLELKLIAAVGIIGLPNAGKSTLISVLSSARPKVANYPFTTLVPNLGVVAKPSGDGVVFADIPGLIEGAHMGIGLGHDFLRHVERTRLLIHLVDITSEQPLVDYETIQAELNAYGHSLPNKPQILVLNKLDAVDDDYVAEITNQFKQAINIEPILISAVTKQGLDRLLQQVWPQLAELEEAARLEKLDPSKALNPALNPEASSNISDFDLGADNELSGNELNDGSSNRPDHSDHIDQSELENSALENAGL
ncbi:GTPase obg [Thalassoporum mexicanum PCC 7367]|nr:GTPase ObgE [Pseudanabaena sp. PCC 7367]AFY69700.1 GTPase obg [Pseudanabaena sp. PCC 7367]